MSSCRWQGIRYLYICGRQPSALEMTVAVAGVGSVEDFLHGAKSNSGCNFPDSFQMNIVFSQRRSSLTLGLRGVQDKSFSEPDINRGQ